MKHLLIAAADGFEEIEMLAVADIMRRLNVKVTIAALNSLTLRGAHRVTITADALLREIAPDSVDALFLPGGMPGAANLAADPALQTLIQKFDADGKIVSAICAAPIVLAKAGLLKGKRFAVYPGFEDLLGGASATGNAAESDGNIVTGRGPGAVFDFALLLAAALGLDQECRDLYKTMFVDID